MLTRRFFAASCCFPTSCHLVRIFKFLYFQSHCTAAESRVQLLSVRLLTFLLRLGRDTGISQSARCVLMRYRAVARWTQVQLPQPLHWLQQPRRHRWVARGWTHNAGRRATAIHCSLYWTAAAGVVRPRLRGRTIQTDERSMMI